MQARQTPVIDKLTRDVVGKSKDAREKALKIWKRVKKISYDIFATTGDIDSAARKGDPQTCYGKALIQGSMLESAGVPWRFEISRCPSSGIDPTIRAIGNPVITKLFEKFKDKIDGKELLHTTVQVFAGGKWTRMDSTIPDEVCDKIDGKKRRKLCHSLDNVTALHGCTVTGHGKELPARQINAWNIISRMGKWASKKIGQERGK
jgi:hypothetical protein